MDIPKSDRKKSPQFMSKPKFIENGKFSDDALEKIESIASKINSPIISRARLVKALSNSGFFKQYEGITEQDIMDSAEVAIYIK